MNSITRYMFRQLGVGMLLVATGLTCVIWLTQSLRFVELIVNRGLSAGAFAYLTVLLLPNFLALILPIALFAVIVFYYTKMINDRELVVMRAAGMSQFAIAKPALILATMVALLGFALNFYFLPKSYQQFRDFQWEIRYNYSHVLLQEGTFNTINNKVTVYVRERTQSGELLGILVHDTREPNKPSTMMAERGAMVEAKSGARVIMFNGNRQVVDRKTMKMSILYFDRYTFDLESSRKAAPSRYREPRERMIGELFNIENDRTIAQDDYGEFWVEGHNRIVSPLYAFTFTFIALACLISGPFNRRGHAKKVSLAILLMVCMETASLGVLNLAAKKVHLIPLIYAVAIVPAVISWVIMSRQSMNRSKQSTPPAGKRKEAS